jgi:HAD superfamily hydrolase (TIGR01493 family)
VYFLSNAGALHVPTVYEKVPRLKFCRDNAFSCDIGAIKPDRVFYERALAQIRHSAGRLPVRRRSAGDVEGAIAFGIPSLLYTTPEETIPAIRARLEM